MQKVTVVIQEEAPKLEPLADLTKLKLVKVRMNNDVVGAPMRHYGIARDFLYRNEKEYFLHPDLAAAWIDCGHCDAVRDVVVTKQLV